MLLLDQIYLLYGIVLMLVALGGMFSEHSGIINIALEGIMVIGGCGGVLTLPCSAPTCRPPGGVPVLVAALAGMVYSLLLAFASINLKADQTIGGTALNLLATAIAVVMPGIQGQLTTPPSWVLHQQAVPVHHRPQFLEQPDLQVFLPPAAIVLLLLS